MTKNHNPNCHHINDSIRQKDDNRISNLRLADAFLNSQNRRSYRGENNPSAVLKNKQVLEIRKKHPQKSYRTLAKEYRVSPTLIAKIIRKEIWN